jgi:hypothetical protein
VTVTLSCATTLDGTAETEKGIYQNRSDGTIPVVTVHAAVPYDSLFGLLNLKSFKLTAESQSAVMGL